VDSVNQAAALASILWR